MEVDDVWVVQVLDGQAAYLEAIGAIGEQLADECAAGGAGRGPRGSGAPRRSTAASSAFTEVPCIGASALAHCSDRGKEVVHKMNDGCCGTSEVAGR